MFPKTKNPILTRDGVYETILPTLESAIASPSGCDPTMLLREAGSDLVHGTNVYIIPLHINTAIYQQVINLRMWKLFPCFSHNSLSTLHPLC